MQTPRSAETRRDDKELAVIRPASAVSLLVLAANFARYHLFLRFLA
jgi:hypothetical protein